MDDTKHQEVSKTQQKKRAQEVFAVAKKLTNFSVKQIKLLDLSEEIKLNIIETKKIKSHAARLRSIKYIASLLRSFENIEDIIKLIKKQ